MPERNSQNSQVADSYDSSSALALSSNYEMMYDAGQVRVPPRWFSRFEFEGYFGGFGRLLVLFVAFTSSIP